MFLGGNLVVTLEASDRGDYVSNPDVLETEVRKIIQSNLNIMKKSTFKFSFSFLRDNLFWTALGVIVTGLVCWVAYSQLAESNREAKKQSKIAAETFLHNLKTDFFTKESRDLIFLIETDALQFRTVKEDSGRKGRELPVFSLNIPDKFEPYVDSGLRVKKYLSSTELDLELLNHFEDLGILYKKCLIDSADIYEYFSYYITLCHENSAIDRYIKWTRTDSTNKDVYDNFDNIYKLVHSMTPSEK